MSKTILLLLTAALIALSGTPRAQADRYADLDHVLDTYVRDGKVYYRALQQDRAALSRSVRALDVPATELAAWSREQREAFWINAYNALVLDTVVEHYPIRGTASAYPRTSIRQIPGAFDRLTHRVAGEMLTLDGIETRMQNEFGDARLVLVLGRGALGGPRLRSDAYRPEAIDEQLQSMVKECAARSACVSLNREARTITVTPLVGWHAEAFEQSFVPAAGDRWTGRSPIERALAAMLEPVMLPSERRFLDENLFRMQYGEFDWSLNEL